ncbi:hypothetical protein D3875_12590 [Deinococcus cavernae]|uniref:Uncharacterized protein n=1 Tax=Deinococcus cavernae TaxID=2320857 RepID=A0A418V869_9DEIO|nr:hypothetical protein [Deinococcus cavernae]RJF72267.1 hypothetical protein D3875_12590 [Deinococcus cavernae]
MNVTSAVTTQRGISVSLTVPAGRYRIIRRAHLYRLRVRSALTGVQAPVQASVQSGGQQVQALTGPHPGWWTGLQTWLLFPDAEQVYTRRQARQALAAEYGRYALPGAYGRPYSTPLYLP